MKAVVDGLDVFNGLTSGSVRYVYPRKANPRASVAATPRAATPRVFKYLVVFGLLRSFSVSLFLLCIRSLRNLLERVRISRDTLLTGDNNLEPLARPRL